ncbi:hypothetical protein TNCV_4290441 [Trichonephila clavipes]|nr:hypothetical protein TNCV_4290441 [Trichonephila clavipes]
MNNSLDRSLSNFQIDLLGDDTLLSAFENFWKHTWKPFFTTSRKVSCDAPFTSSDYTKQWPCKCFSLMRTDKSHTELILKLDGRGRREVKVSDHYWSCHEFEPSTTKDPPCGGVMHVKSVDSSNVLPLVVKRGGMLAQVSSTSLDHGSNLRGPSPKSLV